RRRETVVPPSRNCSARVGGQGRHRRHRDRIRKVAGLPASDPHRADRGPDPTAVYLAPTKALAQDQMQALARLCAATPELADVMVATYDGDTPPEARRAIREQARIIVTNPDMLHASILGNPKRWTRLLKTLRYLVV